MKRILESLSCPSCLVNCCSHNTNNKVDGNIQNTQDDLSGNRDLPTKIDIKQTKTNREVTRIRDELTKTGDKLPPKYRYPTSEGKSSNSTKMFANSVSDGKKSVIKSTFQRDPLRSKQRISKMAENITESKTFEKADKSPPTCVKKFNVHSENKPSEKRDKPCKYRGITKTTDVSDELVSVRKDKIPQPKDTSKFVFIPKEKDALLNSKDDASKPTDIPPKNEKYVFKPSGKKYPSISNIELSKDKSQKANNSIEFLFKPEKEATNPSEDKTKAKDITPTEDDSQRFVFNPNTRKNKTASNDDKHEVSKVSTKEEPLKFVFKTTGIEDEAKAQDDSSKVEDSPKFVFKPLPKEQRLKYEEEVKSPEHQAKYLVKRQSKRETSKPTFDSSLPQYSKHEHDSEVSQSSKKSTLDDDTSRTNDNPCTPEPYTPNDESRKIENDLPKMKEKTTSGDITIRPEDESLKQGKYKSEHEEESSKCKKLPLRKPKEESPKFKSTSKREVESTKYEEQQSSKSKRESPIVEPSPKPREKLSEIEMSSKLKEESAKYEKHPSPKPKEQSFKFEPPPKPKEEPSKLEPLPRHKVEPSKLETSSKLEEKSTKYEEHPCHKSKEQSFKFEPSPKPKDEPSKFVRQKPSPNQNKETSKYDKQASPKPKEESPKYDNHNRPLPCKPKKELPRTKRESTKVTEGPLKKKASPPRAVDTKSVKSHGSDGPLFPCKPINYEKYTAYSALPSTLQGMLEGHLKQRQRSLAALESTCANSLDQSPSNLVALEAMSTNPSETTQNKLTVLEAKRIRSSEQTTSEPQTTWPPWK